MNTGQIERIQAFLEAWEELEKLSHETDQQSTLGNVYAEALDRERRYQGEIANRFGVGYMDVREAGRVLSTLLDDAGRA